MRLPPRSTRRLRCTRNRGRVSREACACAWACIVAPRRNAAGNYFGPEVNLAARVMSAAWGGQILCTDAIVESRATTFASDDCLTRFDHLGGHQLRDVDGTVALHQVNGSDLPADFPPPRTLDVAPTTIPAQRSSFVGRGDDIAAVRRLLLDHRLVTLTGPGGTGKTRLAIEIAGREQPHHPGGAFFADLASLENGDRLAATVARACLVALDASRAPLDQLTDALRARDVLLVLDNCEHVLDAAAELVDRVLALCPDVVILATSREPLELAGEHIHVVAPLDTRRRIGRGRALCATRRGGGWRTARGRRRRCRGAVHPPRRHPTRDRARGRSSPHVQPGADTRTPRRPPRRPVRHAPAGPRSSPDAARRDQVELRAPERSGAGVVRPARGVRGFVRPLGRGERRGHRRP